MAEKLPVHVHQITDPDQFFQTSLKEAMGACHFQGLLLLFLVGASTLISMYWRCGGREWLGQGGWISGEKRVIWGPGREGQVLIFISFSPQWHRNCFVKRVHSRVSKRIQQTRSTGPQRKLKLVTMGHCARKPSCWSKLVK